MFSLFKRSTLVVLLLIGLLLSSASVAQDDAIVLQIGGVSGNDVTWLNEHVIPAFEAMMAEQGINVTVEVIEIGGFGAEELRQQYVLDLSVGEGADILSFDGFWLPEFVDGGLAKPLTELAGPEVLDWEGWEMISEGAQSLLSFNGELYGIARGTDGRVLWIRTDLLAEAGIPADWQPTSWEEVLEAARMLKETFPDMTPLQINAGTAMGEATTMQGFFMLLLGAGHHLYDFENQKWYVSSPALLETLRLYEDIYVTEGLGNTRWQLVENGRDLSFQAFISGETAMLVEGDYFWRSPMNPTVGDYGLEDQAEKMSFVYMPAMEPGAGINGQDFVSISGGTGYILNQNTEHPQEAWALLSFMFSKDMVDALQQIEPRIRARTDVEIPGDEIMTRIASEVMPFSTIRPQLAEYNQISVEIQLMTERVVSGEMSPEEAMAAFDEAVTELVGEENVIRIPLE